MSRVLIAHNARGCEGYRADPRQSSFGTCAAAGSSRDGSGSPRAAGADEGGDDGNCSLA